MPIPLESRRTTRSFGGPAWWAWLVLWLAGLSLVWAAGEQTLDLGEGKRIALAGNGTARRLAEHGYLELALHASFPERNLLVRSFTREGYRVDEPGEAMAARLREFGPDVIFFAVGLNESFDGPAGLLAFQTRLRERLQDWAALPATSRDRPQIILIPPVVYRQMEPGQPEERPVHERMQPYVDAMEAVAAGTPDTVMLDVWRTFGDLAETTNGAVTRDGIHLNRRGHWLLAMVASHQLRFPTSGVEGAGHAAIGSIRTAIRRRERAWAGAGWLEGRGIRVWDEAIWETAKPSLDEIWAWEPDAFEFIGGANQRVGVPGIEVMGLDGFVSGEDAIETMSVHGDLEVSLWASERAAPLWNPVSMAFDGAGRLFVGCRPPREEPFVLRMEDVDHDHRADRHTVFLRGPGLQPEGLLPDPAGVYVSGEHGLFHYADANGDGIAEQFREVIPGVGGRIVDLTWGPGGSAWLNETKSGGIQVETAWGIQRSEQPGLYGWNPRVGKLEHYAGISGQGSLGLQFDRWGRALACERSSGRVAFLEEIGGWRETGPGLVAPEGIGGVGAWLTGIYFWRPFQGSYLRGEAQPGGAALRWYRPYHQGGVDVWERVVEPVWQSEDPLFWPAEIQTGPDGALYVLDAYGKRRSRSGQWLGRIWRIGVKNRAPVWTPHLTPGEEVESLFEQLREEEPRVRAQVRQAIWQLPANEVLPRLERWVKRLSYNDPDRQQLLQEALWLNQAFGAPDGVLLARVTESPQPGVRAASAKLVADWHERLPEPYVLLQRLMEDEIPEVRAAALHAARRIGTEQAGDVARTARHHRMSPAMARIFEDTVTQLGTFGEPPPSMRAKAIGTSNADLIAGEMTPHAATVLLERPGVELSGLIRAAAVASRRTQQSLAQWMVDRVEDRQSSTQLIHNVERLLPKADGWDLHRSTYRLHEMADRDPREEVRRFAYAALTVGAASSRSMDVLRARVEQKGDFHVTEWLTASESVAAHSSVRYRIKTPLREELAVPPPASTRPAAKVRILALEGRPLGFTEVEVLSGGKNVARDRPAVQSAGAGVPAWWARLAPNGVNGITDSSHEFPVKDSRPSSDSVRGVQVGAGAQDQSNAWWEVDLDGTVPVSELIFYPGVAPERPVSLRFELRDAEDRVSWSTTRWIAGAGALRVDVHMGAERIAAASRVARKLGDDFKTSLVTVAQHSTSTGARFSAIRALRRIGGLPGSIRFLTFGLEARPDGFNRKSVTVAPKTALELPLDNQSGHDLMLAICRAGSNGDQTVVYDLGRVGTGDWKRLEFFAPSQSGTYYLRNRDPAVTPELALQIIVRAPPPPPAAKP